MTRLNKETSKIKKAVTHLKLRKIKSKNNHNIINTAPQ